jgi:ABC-2 type transport system permease protein
LGVSAISRTSRNTIILWVGLWLILGAVAKPPGTPSWLRRASFVYNLGEVRQGILRLDHALTTAAEGLPITSQGFLRDLRRAGGKAQATDFNGALASLGVFVVLSSFVFLRRLRPE